MNKKTDNEKDEATSATSPKSKNSTLAGEKSAHVEDTTPEGDSTTEKALCTTVTEALSSVLDKILAARKAPEEAADRPSETDNLRNAADNATPADNNSPGAAVTHGHSGSANEIPLMTSWEDRERKIWEQCLNKDLFGEVFLSDTGLHYHVLWFGGRPYFRLHDVQEVIVSALRSFDLNLQHDLWSEGYLSEIDCSGIDSYKVDLSEMQTRRLKRFADFGLYLPLDDVIDLIGPVGDLEQEVYDLCLFRRELEDRTLSQATQATTS